MVGTPCWAASTTARPQPSLRDGSTCTHEPCSTWCLVTSSTWPWKVTASEMPSRCAWSTSRCRHQPSPTTSRCRSGIRGPQLRDRVQRILDLLVRHQPRQHHHPRCGRPRAGQRLRRRLVETVAHHRDPLVVHTERDQIARRRQRHRHVLVAPVQPRRQRRLDEPADPAEHRPGHRPLLAVAVVHQHHRPVGRRSAGPGTASRSGCRRPRRAAPARSGPSPRRASGHRQQRPDVHRVAATGAADPHPVDDLMARRARDSGRCAT